MKKIVSLLLALVMCLSLCACGGGSTAENTESTESAADTAAAEVSAIAAASVGQSVTYGEYNQDNYITDGTKSIEWKVLDIRDGKVLLLSVYALDCYKFDSDTTIWKDSAVRDWLNSDFLNMAFTAEEQAYIATSEITTTHPYEEPDVITHDRVFLLSQDELSLYFPDEDDIDRLAVTADYAEDQDLESYNVVNMGRTCNWWLRSGYYSYALWVGGQMGNHGEICELSPYKEYGIRPAIWLDIALLG